MKPCSAIFDQLIVMADENNFSFEELDDWTKTVPLGKRDLKSLLNEFAIYAAQKFLDGSLNFYNANGVLNQIMAVTNFEAPNPFWEMYIAFEDFEISENPNNDARDRIRSLLDRLSTP